MHTAYSSSKLHHLLTSSFTQKSFRFYSAFLILTLLPLYIISYHYRLAHPYTTSSSSSKLTNHGEEFLESWLETRLVEPFNPSALGRFCEQTRVWRKGVVFRMEGGGTTNASYADARQEVLEFVVRGIEAGVGIILPGLTRRVGGTTEEEEVVVGFEELFDRDWFLDRFSEACPQLVVYEAEEGKSVPEAVGGVYEPLWRGRREEEVERFEAWLGRQGVTGAGGGGKAGGEEVVVVNMKRGRFGVDTWGLPGGVRRSLGQVLRGNEGVGRVAGVVVRELGRRFGVRVGGGRAVMMGGVYGAYLHALGQGIEGMNTTEQGERYLKQAIAHGLSVMYVASNDRSEVEAMKARTASMPYLNVTTKEDLLTGSALESLKQLTPDQQALVDLEVLQRCSLFGGATSSTFSYGIASARNQWLEDHGRPMDPWFVVHKDTGVTFDDGISRLVGRDAFVEAVVPRGMWP